MVNVKLDYENEEDVMFIMPRVWEKSESTTGIEPVTFCTPVRCSTH